MNVSELFTITKEDVEYLSFIIPYIKGTSYLGSRYYGFNTKRVLIEGFLFGKLELDPVKFIALLEAEQPDANLRQKLVQLRDILRDLGTSILRKAGDSTIWRKFVGLFKFLQSGTSGAKIQANIQTQLYETLLEPTYCYGYKILEQEANQQTTTTNQPNLGRVQKAFHKIKEKTIELCDRILQRYSSNQQSWIYKVASYIKSNSVTFFNNLIEKWKGYAVVIALALFVLLLLSRLPIVGPIFNLILKVISAPFVVVWRVVGWILTKLRIL